MKIVIIGGTGLIGSKLAARLRASGHEVVQAAPKTGVDAVTGEGLAEVMAGTAVVVDVSNSPSFADDAVMDFFVTSGRNLMAAESQAGIRHHVALSIVGTDRLPDSGYMRAKVAQEAIVEGSGVPHTIVRSTQFFEFLTAIADAGATAAGEIVLPAVLFQPIAADDVVEILAEIATNAPLDGRIEIAGPEKAPFARFVEPRIRAAGDGRTVRADRDAGYFGTKVDDGSLTPGASPRLGSTRFDAWLSRL